MAKCKIIKAKCPMNGDPERGDYCPHWENFIETNDDTGETRVQSGCDIPVMRRWMADVQRAGWISGKFMSHAANAVIKSENTNQRHLTAVPLVEDQTNA